MVSLGQRLLEMIHDVIADGVEFSNVELETGDNPMEGCVVSGKMIPLYQVMMACQEELALDEKALRVAEEKPPRRFSAEIIAHHELELKRAQIAHRLASRIFWDSLRDEFIEQLDGIPDEYLALRGRQVVIIDPSVIPVT